MSCMIKNYSEYISKYILKFKLKNTKGKVSLPGEHHFVSVYLLDRLIQITGRIPDYVNPDGAKHIPGGDLVWYNDNDEYEFGIEVKFKNAKLTRKEFDEWLVGNENKPKLFIGISKKGIILLKWDDFIKVYKKAVEYKKNNFPTKSNEDVPSCSIDDLFRKNKIFEQKDIFFEYMDEEKGKAVDEENNFLERLRSLVKVTI